MNVLLMFFIFFLFLGSESQKETYFWHNLQEKNLYKFEHGAAQTSLLIQPPPCLSVPFTEKVVCGLDWYPVVGSYMQQQGYSPLKQTLAAGSGPTLAESIRPGCKFELREAAQPCRFWGVTVVENVGGGSGLLGLGYDSPELRPRLADLRLFYSDPRLCPVGTVAGSGGKYEFQAGFC